MAKFVSLLWIFVALSPGFVTSKDVSFLMIGNSFSNANHLQEMIKAMLEDSMLGSQVYAMRFRKPESRFNDDIHDPSLPSIIAERSWEWVILQEQSQIPAFMGTYYDPTFQLSINATITMNRWIAQDGAETVLLMTWARRGADFMYPEMFPNFTYMQDRLEIGYTTMQKEISIPDRPVRIAPAGLAYRAVHDSIPGNASADGTMFTDLYDLDGLHPSVQGSYLIACVLFATLTGNDPRHFTRYSGPDEINQQRRAALREFAATTVLSFNQENEINQQYFARHNDSPLDPSSDGSNDGDKEQKPYIPKDAEDPKEGSTRLWLVVPIGAIAFVVFRFKRDKGTTPRPYNYLNESPQDFELIDMPNKPPMQDFQ